MFTKQLTNDEDPLPSLKRCFPVQAFIHSCHHNTREHAANLADSCKDGCSFCDLQRFAVVHINNHLLFTIHQVRLTYYQDPRM